MNLLLVGTDRRGEQAAVTSGANFLKLLQWFWNYKVTQIKIIFV